MKHVSVRHHDDTSKRISSDWQFHYDWMLDANAEREFTDQEVLEIVWEQWNAGSGNESKQFLNLGIRSMMVGDYVSVDGTWHEVLKYGWRINVPWEEVMGDTPKKDFNELAENFAKEVEQQFNSKVSDETSLAE